MNTKIKKQLGLIALALIMFIVTLDTTITNIALPTITDVFHTTLDISSWISTIYVLILSALIIPAAKLGDQLGRKKVMVFGLIIFGLGSLLCSLSASMFFLIVARGVQAVGGAITTPILVPLCVSLFGRKKANSAVGQIGAVAAFAAAVGPAVGGIIIQYWSWQGIFIVNLPIILLTIILIILCFVESYDNTISKKIDYFGVLLLSITLALITFVLLKGYDYGWSSKRIIVMIFVSIILFAIFVVTDLHKEAPLIEFKLFKNLTFTASTAIYFACGFAIVCSSVIFNLFLENVRNYSALHAGLIIMFSSLMVMVAMPLGNLLGQRLSFRWPLMTGTFLMSVSVLLLTQLTYQISVFNMIFTMCLLGFGFGLSSLSLVAAVQYIPEEKAGIASGMVNASRQIGTCLGIALLVGLLNNNVSNSIGDVRTETLQAIDTGQLSQNVKKVSAREVRRCFIYDSADKKENTFRISEIRKVLDSDENIPSPKSTSDLYELYIGNQHLSQATEKMISNLLPITQQSTSLNAGSKQVSESFKKLNKGTKSLSIGQDKLSTGIALLAEKQELQRILNHSKRLRNEKLAQAFNHTYLVSTIILFFFVPIAYLTDKNKHVVVTVKSENKSGVKRYD